MILKFPNTKGGFTYIEGITQFTYSHVEWKYDPKDKDHSFLVRDAEDCLDKNRSWFIPDIIYVSAYNDRLRMEGLPDNGLCLLGRVRQDDRDVYKCIVFDGVAYLLNDEGKTIDVLK